MLTLNITKEYIINKPFEESFSQLDSITSTPFNNSKYSLFGNFVSVDPPEFILMTKWWSIGKPMLAEASSTKLFVRLEKEEEKSKITVTTKTNPALAVAFVITVTVLLIKLITTFREWQDMKHTIPYLLIIALIITGDRFLKKLLIARFERDLKVKAS